MIYLGFDGGGTTTRAVLVAIDNSGVRVLGRGSAASSNHYSVGIERAIDNIRACADEALRAGSVQKSDVTAWGFGLAGACTADEQEMLRQKIAPLTKGAPFIIDEDVAAAHAGAFSTFSPHSTPNFVQQAGVICIAGTGANSFGIDENGKRARADGLGPLLGDRGSGYRIGENVLRAVCAHADGSGAATILHDRVLDFLHVADVDALVPLVYSANFSKNRVAALFPIVLDCARENDQIAQDILQMASEELASTCRSVMKQLNVARVIFSGGVLSTESPIRSRLQALLSREFQEFELCEAAYQADVGAALLAIKHIQ